MDKPSSPFVAYSRYFKVYCFFVCVSILHVVTTVQFSIELFHYLYHIIFIALTAELWAILIAIKSLFTLDVGDFVIFSDSRAALSALEDFNNDHPIVSDIFNWLVLAVRRGRRISFCWVSANVSVKGNEEADELAKTGASRQVIACPVPHRDLFPTIRGALHVVWQERRNASMMGAITARAVSPWSYAHVRGRCRETVLARLRTGHTLLIHGFLVSRGVEPYCDDCLVPLTVRHLLVECPSLKELREQYLAQCRGRDGSFSLSGAGGGGALPGA